MCHNTDVFCCGRLYSDGLHCIYIIQFILQYITQNQDRFVAMLNEEDGPADAPAAGAQAPDQAPPGTTYIQISPQEREAIDRVCIIDGLSTLNGVG